MGTTTMGMTITNKVTDKDMGKDTDADMATDADTAMGALINPEDPDHNWPITNQKTLIPETMGAETTDIIDNLDKIDI